MEMQADGFKPPYMSFQTFWNFLADLSAKPLPRKLDRSIMTSKSGTDQNNLMAALQAFNFIDQDGIVQRTLEEFAASLPERRKELLATLVQSYYGPAMQVSIHNGSPAALNEAFRDEMGMTASDTRRKAITFFLHAARESGIELSPHFPKTRSGSGSPGTPKPRRATAKRKSTANSATPPGPAQPLAADGDTYTVELASGGAVSVVVSVNLFALTTEDRTFVIDLVDKLKGYPKAARTATPKEADAS